jgi:phosphohistidine phosphatase
MNRTFELWLMRHATPEDTLAKRDEDRHLDEIGHREARHQGEAMKAAGLGFGLIVSSPLKRALQTAEHVAREVGYEGEIIEDARLCFDATVDEMIAAVAEQKAMHRDLAHVLLVGHSPAIGHLKARLIHAPEETGFSKGAVYGFSVEMSETGEITNAKPIHEMARPMV